MTNQPTPPVRQKACGNCHEDHKGRTLCRGATVFGEPMKNKTLSTLKSELLKEFKEKKWWVGFKSRVTSTGDAKLTEKELWSFISSALDTVVGETMEGIVGRIEDMVERIHTKHYARWIPTEEQKGYRKCQMDIIKSFKRDKWLKGEK